MDAPETVVRILYALSSKGLVQGLKDVK